jgi:hypothetical protein
VLYLSVAQFVGPAQMHTAYISRVLYLQSRRSCANLSIRSMNECIQLNLLRICTRVCLDLCLNGLITACDVNERVFSGL